MPVACSQVPLSAYQPKNQTEKEIKAVLINYLKAKQQFNINAYLDCLYDQGEFHFECGRFLTKEELGQLLPGFWNYMRSGDPSFYPINRECITGDYFDTGDYINPVIEARDDKAQVTLTFSVGWWRLNHYISLIKHYDCWLIKRLYWEMN